MVTRVGEGKVQSPPVARQLSVRAIMGTVLERGPTSRAEMAKLTGLSRQTTMNVALELEREGWLQVSGRTQGPLGRSAPTYDINLASAFVLGIRLEGTILQMALADLRGSVVNEVSEPTDPRGGIHVVHQVGRAFETLTKQANVPRDRVRIAVMGSPGVVDPGTGHIDIAPSIPHLADLIVVEAMRSELKLALFIENGVKLAALGEMWQGAAHGKRNFAYFGVGYGVGMGIVADGRLLRGARGAAGEIAYLPLGGDPFDPVGFANGTFELAVGAPAVIRRYEGYGGRAGQTVGDIFEALDHDDHAAAAAVEEVARLVTIAISALGAFLDPELVVLGGSVGRRAYLAERVCRLLQRTLPRPLDVTSSKLGERATLVGALGEALNRLHAELFGVEAVRADISMMSNPTG